MRLLTRTEEYILLAVWRLQGNAYSIPIRAELASLTKQKWSLGAVYMPLDRLVKKGMLTSSLSEATPERGGRQKRIYELTRAGKQALLDVRAVDERMWAGIANLAVE